MSSLSYSEMKKIQAALMEDWKNRDKEFWKEVEGNLVLGKSELVAFDAVAAFFMTVEKRRKIKDEKNK